MILFSYHKQKLKNGQYRKSNEQKYLGQMWDGYFVLALRGLQIYLTQKQFSFNEHQNVAAR
jgi:hypothetical protein